MHGQAWIGLALLIAAVATAGGAWAWQRHRAHLAEIQRRLAWSEESRLELEQRAESVDARLEALTRALAAQQQALAAAGTPKAPQPAAAGTPLPAAAWADTQPWTPVASPQADTQPAPPYRHAAMER